LFTFEFNIVFWTLVSFGAVYYVIGRKIYPAVAALLQARADKIAADLTLAAAKNKSAEELRGQIDARLQNLRLEEQQILSAAQEKARQTAELKTQEYQTEFAKMCKTKEKELQKVELDFYRNFEEKIGKILIGACEKVLRCDLTPEFQQEIITARLEELKKMKEF